MAFDLKKIEKELWDKIRADPPKPNLESIVKKLNTIEFVVLVNHEILKEIMSDISNLTNIATDEETQIAAINAAIPGLQSGLNNLATALTLAQSEEVPQAVVDALTQADTDLRAAVGGLQGITIPTVPADPDAPAAPVAAPVDTTAPPVADPTDTTTGTTPAS
jgi:hypothetical protein